MREALCSARECTLSCSRCGHPGLEQTDPQHADNGEHTKSEIGIENKGHHGLHFYTLRTRTSKGFVPSMPDARKLTPR